MLHVLQDATTLRLMTCMASANCSEFSLPFLLMSTRFLQAVREGCIHRKCVPYLGKHRLGQLGAREDAHHLHACGGP